MTREILRVDGMRAEHDRRVVQDLLRALPGVVRVAVNLADHTVRIERNDEASLATIIQVMRDAGYSVAVLA
ncbi:heavy-metal-associated domain-containing protein [Oscillochloris sp. ZM17-4]|uniref:heavy-metal-associated domain-containing protein n=1 Tax=Oscillochloris sp. ZM17-4 TaxID=2866714 RepID=UPI001C7336E8|nr:heavy metal-associated domain-containing protein [Oscillochloris sp. ZM17-4]MBX0328518.1 heavy-metal-associated domain-containing protein [Oscillochloris sp. ZM17-4]